VGLGKTIEAGLIIKELRARQAIERVLVICPASIARQWQTELGSKFNESFEIIDGVAAKHFGRGGRNPFNQVDSAICSLPFATLTKRSEQIVEAGWDLIVFDEAHRVRRTRTGGRDARTTLAYRLAKDLKLKDQVHGLLLLTATPVQLHPYELYSLIELVEPTSKTYRRASASRSNASEACPPPYARSGQETLHQMWNPPSGPREAMRPMRQHGGLTLP
jgi:SNF2 family DNA or RNA helicase